MFGLGMGEILIIGTVLILVIRPKDLPKVFRGLGRAYGEIRRFTSSFMRHINTLDS
ncbi:MAG: twin-arginine translocase TatA/TatE family subunit [bacterium]|nr:twin-arginine translocase TatA/TatE family subunit [bacterium]